MDALSSSHAALDTCGTLCDSRWEVSGVGYAVIAPMQGYAQLAEMETDGAAFSNAAASSYDLADQIFVNGSVGVCFDAYDLPLTLDTMAAQPTTWDDFYGPASWNVFTRQVHAASTPPELRRRAHRPSSPPFNFAGGSRHGVHGWPQVSP